MAQPDIAAQYTEALAQFRQQKDAYFAAAEDSPITEEERATFTGLRYFPPDFALRVEAKVERMPQRDHVKMATSDGLTRLYERYAVLHFKLNGVDQQLAAFRTADSPDADDADPTLLFVPFRDTLAGATTYGAGRYLDVEEQETVGGVNTVAIIDFNLAYNPYCAYNDQFSCPITPAENVLTVPVQAGEMVYHDQAQ